MNRKVTIGSLTITLLCFGCEPVETPYGSETTTNPNVQAYLGGPSEIRANFQDGLTTLGWSQYDDATTSRTKSGADYLIAVDDDSIINPAQSMMISVREPLSVERSIVPRQKDGKIMIPIVGQNQLRIQWHSHPLRSCINRPQDTWHINLVIEKQNTPKADNGIINIHLAAWKDGSQKCLGILVTGKPGQELFCRVQCFNKPGKQEIRDTLTAALVAAGVATSVTAGWLANTAAPAMESVLAL